MEKEDGNRKKTFEENMEEVRQEAEAMLNGKSNLAVWRVEQLSLNRVKDEDVGVFYKGDCYIILSLAKGSQFYIHYWLGSDSTLDERGFAAMATVEIDEKALPGNGSAVEVREENGTDKGGRPLESPRFLKMFEGNYLVKSGGVKSGFRKVSEANEPAHLFIVKGKQRPVVNEILCRTSSLNSGDCFILDVSRKHKQVIVLRGSKSNKDEGKRAIEMARKFRVKVTVLDENEVSSCDDDVNRILHDSLGVSRTRPVKFEGLDRLSDEEYQSEEEKKTGLFRVDKHEFKPVDCKKSSLDSEHLFILKTSTTIFVWKGRNLRNEEKREASKMADEFIKKSGISKTRVCVISQKMETVDFKACFADWLDDDEYVKKVDYSKPSGKSNVAKSVHTVIDFRTLYNKPQENVTTDPFVKDDVDCGKGKKQIYRIKPEGKDVNDERILETNKGFVFNSGESYVIVYQYRSRQAENREKAIIYFWIGNDSEQKEYGAAAIVASDIDAEQFHDDALQIRVTEAKEPPHFMMIFGGFIMIKQPNFNDNGPRLFHIRGKEGNIKVVEVPDSASNLNSLDCFVLKTPRKKAFIWHGKGSLGDEQRIAHEAATSMFGRSCEFEKLSEGKETQNFWDAIGGKKKYYDAWEGDAGKGSNKKLATREPRLYRLFNVRGGLEIEEIYDFSQDDLIEDDVFYLDVYSSIYIWIGQHSTKDERRMASAFLTPFIKKDPSGRQTEDVMVYTVPQGREPTDFKAHFCAWEDHRTEKMTYEDMKRMAIDESSEMSASKYVDLLHLSKNAEYSYEQLTTNAQELPETVDLTKKEWYLSMEEFQKHFGMTKEQFCEKPSWKQIELKKRAKLF